MGCIFDTVGMSGSEHFCASANRRRKTDIWEYGGKYGSVPFQKRGVTVATTARIKEGEVARRTGSGLGACFRG